jgi:hypothetical protein
MRNFRVSISLPEFPLKQNEVEFRLRAQGLRAAIQMAIVRLFARPGHLTARRPTKLILTAEDLSARLLGEDGE